MPNRQRRIKLSLLSGILFVIIIIAMFMFSKDITSQPTPDPVPTVQQGSEAESTFSYEGREGVDALTLLEEQAEVEKTPQGFVTAINGRKADEAKREFWSFYVNGEPSQVGAGEYETESADKIEWRIETY